MTQFNFKFLGALLSFCFIKFMVFGQPIFFRLTTINSTSEHCLSFLLFSDLEEELLYQAVADLIVAVSGNAYGLPDVASSYCE